ncbi:putative transcription factor WD40-like family [Arabidopsis thaliana]|uniref:Transducin/WD40 repeat-like superfamily protein n=4 Tax=Arabidopsis TaxID=3701 RepID=F4HQX6_ARATH|nr:Transducin/WD40 repeat-like superfamily protein [Arabidopsis thaliana]AEE29894.1 Transducin/WD40 repeat-like superfamily protein [Arabidopsis thaliana]KAG7646916.1 WD40 repeat [Arabidopsis thaliana x Arabidopsis arenosa]|eukprot:NP_173405.2 Transducin/WD40 repeat-like superfamily protein [Arabidopsis thaliana]
MWKAFKDRETGRFRSNSFANRFKSRRILSLQLSNRKDFVSPHRGSVNSLQVDLTEGRYLLSGAADGSAAVFDVKRATDYEASGLIAKHKCIFTVRKQHENGHKYAISSAIWYPIDTGMFITGSFDHYVKVWDTNTSQVVVDFKMPGKVYRTAMSSMAMSHTLIAAGTDDVQVRLCDIASGAFSHTLSGHRDGVMSVEWSTSSEWVLYTGGCDGAIRFWDIRRAGCFRVLDNSQTQLGVRPPILKRPAVSSKFFSAAKSSLGDQNWLKTLQSKHTGSQSVKGSSSEKPSVEKSRQKRIHPGMLSTLDRATAHYGVVTGLKATNDGMYLLSAGSYSRIRLWDIESGRNTLVNFETGRIQTDRAIQLDTSDDPALVFVPCMKTVKGFGMWSGRTTLMLRGHYESVNTCCFNSNDQELYTSGADRQIIVWSPGGSVEDEMAQGEVAEDKDNWSD